MLPDLAIEVAGVFNEGDKDAVRDTRIATDTEGLMGRPPTGKVTRTAAIQICRCAGGRIVESNRPFTEQLHCQSSYAGSRTVPR